MTTIIREGKVIQKDGKRVDVSPAGKVDPAGVPVAGAEAPTQPNDDPSSATYGKPQIAPDVHLAAVADVIDKDTSGAVTARNVAVVDSANRLALEERGGSDIPAEDQIDEGGIHDEITEPNNDPASATFGEGQVAADTGDRPQPGVSGDKVNSEAVPAEGADKVDEAGDDEDENDTSWQLEADGVRVDGPNGAWFTVVDVTHDTSHKEQGEDAAKAKAESLRKRHRG